MSRVRIVTLLVFQIMLFVTADLIAAEPERQRLYWHSGVFGSYENKVYNYETSDAKFIIDIGYERLNYPCRRINGVERLGIAWNIVFDSKGIRNAVGPKLTWKLTEMGRIQATVVFCVLLISAISSISIST